MTKDCFRANIKSNQSVNFLSEENNMLKLGLTSVTFRSLGADKIIEYCKKCGLSAIEWGSDVHVPSGDAANAAEIAEKCKEAGIAIPSYGSYYTVGSGDDFSEYIACAKALGASVIRVWGGHKSSADLTQAERRVLIDDTKRICKAAQSENIDIAFEYHNNSLTDNAESVLSVINDVGESNLGTYFQYAPWVSPEENCKALTALLPYLKTVHIFNIDQSSERFSIGEHGGAELWKSFSEILKSNNSDIYMLFEFLKNESLEGLRRETEIMKSILKSI